MIARSAACFREVGGDHPGERNCSIFESRADEVAFTPDQAALLNCDEVVESQFEKDRQHREVMRPKFNAAVRKIDDAATARAGLAVEE